MIRKTEEFEQALSLRKRGFTYDEIAKYVNVSKSTISNWLSRETWSESIASDNIKRAARDNSKRISLLNKARGNQNNKLYAQAERSAEIEYKHYKNNPSFIAGLMLYAASGDLDRGQPIRLSSNRIDTHRIFISFAEEYLGAPREKIRFWLALSPTLDPETCSRKWSKAIKIPIVQFHKYQVIQTAIKKPTLHFGVGNTIIGNTVLKRKLIRWIALATKQL